MKQCTFGAGCEGGMCYADAHGEPDRCDMHPDEPSRDAKEHYRGWECEWSSDNAYWVSRGWLAYKGGSDIGAPTVNESTWEQLLTAIDEEEKEYEQACRNA